MRILMELHEQVYELIKGSNCPRCDLQSKHYCLTYCSAKGVDAHCNRAALTPRKASATGHHWEEIM